MSKRVIEGNVRIHECDFPDWYWTYGDVETDEQDNLVDILEDEFKDKRVRVTIEVIEETERGAE